MSYPLDSTLKAIGHLIRGAELQRADAEDLVQDVVEAVLKVMQKYDPDRGDREGLTYVKSRSAAITWMSRRKRHAELEKEQAPPARAVDGERAVIQRDLLLHVLGAKLKPYEVHAVAAELGCREQAPGHYMALKRARVKMRARLEAA